MKFYVLIMYLFISLLAATSLQAADAVAAQEVRECVICKDGDGPGKQLLSEEAARLLIPLPCTHSDYHDACLQQWLTQKNVCPLCQAPGAQNQILARSLREAVVRGDFFEVDRLLTEGAYVPSVSHNGLTLLHCAAIQKSSYVFGSILAALGRGYNVNVPDNNRTTPLHCAAFAGNGYVASVLLGLGADVYAQDNDGVTPLHFAAMQKELFILNALLAAGRGGNVNTLSVNGNTALHCAALSGDVTVVSALLAAGGNVHVQNNEGKTAIQVAYGQGNMGVVAILGKAMIPVAVVATAGIVVATAGLVFVGAKYLKKMF